MNVDLFNLSSNFDAESTWALNANYDPTPLDVFVVNDNNFDVQARDADYGARAPYGWNNCPADAETGGQHPSKWCHGQVVRFNLHYPHTFDTLKERRSRACHEFGHTVGLDHEAYRDSCLELYTHSRTEYLSPHDVALIEREYG